MNWSFINILMLFGALQGFLIVLILFLKKENNKKARFYLALILFGLSMNLLYYFTYVVGLIDKYPALKLIYLPWSILSAIAFYLYISFISPFKKKLTVLNKLGFVPFLLFSIVLVFVKCYNYITIPEEQINSNLISLIFATEEFFGVVFSLVIGYLSHKKLNKIELEVQQQFSNYNSSKLQFHKRLIKVVFIFCIVWVVAITYAQLNNLASLSIYFSIWLFMAFVIHWIAWTGFINDSSLLPTFKNSRSLSVIKSKEIVESTTGLMFDQSSDYYKKLIYLFEKEKLFLEPELSLEDVSNKLEISKSYLSALINQTTNKNFYHFVNSYRTLYLISLFKEKKDEKFTILSLAFDAGFNSKSTFQAFFKKNTGKTPTQYIKTLEAKDFVA
ncbi:MAG: helix-turn-helix domain-containing protein [Polaribacter sp.]